MDKETVGGGVLIVTAGIGWSTGKRKKWFKWIGWGAIAFGIGVIVYGTVKDRPVPPPPIAVSASTGGAASVGQSGGVTAGTYTRTAIMPGVNPEELARRKKIREDLGHYIERLLAYDVAVRGGWDEETIKRAHREDPSGEIYQYLQKNLDESYAARFIYPEVEDLSTKNYDNQYIGQAQSESARAHIKFLHKVVDELK